MRWLKKALAGYNYGKALGKFYKGRYEEAALLFERVLRVNTDDRKELSQAYLGRCHLAMGMNNDALQLMTQAYDLYLTRKDILKHDYDRREFIAFIDSYTHLLKKAGQSARAREIAVEINKLVIKEECPENLNLKGI